MTKRILVVSNCKDDLALFNNTIGANGFDIESISKFDETGGIILNRRYDAILVDYDLVGDKADQWMALIRENEPRVCFIVYGDRSSSDKVSEMLQSGVYGFVPRDLLSERIYDTLVDGLENRKAFTNILEMIDELKNINEKLEKEKEALNTKNQALSFINRLSSEVAYDLDWDNILPRIIDAGFLEVIEPKFIAVMYRIGSEWNIAFYVSNGQNDQGALEKLKRDIVNRFCSLSGEKISIEEVGIRLYPSGIGWFPTLPNSIPKQHLHLLSSAGKPLGMLIVVPREGAALSGGTKELFSTLSNILSMSLNNAQEHHRLKELTIKDGLTGILNHKGFKEFVKTEFLKAKRYNKQFSLVMIDLDDFKRINDSYGHLAGDYILQEFTACMKHSLRQTDILARCGGDEFVIILPETETKQAQVLMRRLQLFIRNHHFSWKSHKIKVGFSYGISTTEQPVNVDSVEELISSADTQLYHTKRSQNLVHFAAGRR